LIYFDQVDLFPFADDSTLVCAEQDQNNFVIKLKMLMDRAYEGFEANCLALNDSKDQFSVLYRIGLQFPDLNIIPSSEDIIPRLQNRFVRILGVFVNENLSLKNHINLLRLKV